VNDTIVDEVRRVRGEHAARFNYDLWAIFKDIKEQQERSGLTFVSFADEPKKSRQPTGPAIPVSDNSQLTQSGPAPEY
jgi:hypothetical protein